MLMEVRADSSFGNSPAFSPSLASVGVCSLLFVRQRQSVWVFTVKDLEQLVPVAPTHVARMRRLVASIRAFCLQSLPAFEVEWLFFFYRVLGS